MALTAEMHNRGGRGLERDVVAIIERTLRWDRPGEWRVSNHLARREAIGGR